MGLDLHTRHGASASPTKRDSLGSRSLPVDLLSMESLVPVEGAVGDMAFHAADTVFERIKFRFELSESDLSGAGVGAFENDASRSIDRGFDGLQFHYQSENKVD